MKEKTQWFGQIRGIGVEIQRFKSFDERAFAHSWTYYLYLLQEQFPEDVQPAIKTEVYYTAFGTPIEIHIGPISEIYWHGGLTWSSDETRPGFPFRQFKFGCDFQHFWDEGQHYSFDDVQAEAAKTVDELFTTWPMLKSTEQLWEAHRAKFPGAADKEHHRFDIEGNPNPAGGGENADKD